MLMPVTANRSPAPQEAPREEVTVRIIFKVHIVTLMHTLLTGKHIVGTLPDSSMWTAAFYTVAVTTVGHTTTVQAGLLPSSQPSFMLPYLHQKHFKGVYNIKKK